GQRVDGVEEVPLMNGVVARVDDLNPAHALECHSVTISWGDNTPPSTGELIVDPEGDVVVVGDHTYAEAGSYLVSVDYADEVGHSLTLHSTATIDDLPIGVEASSIHPVAGMAFSQAILGRVTDSNPFANGGDITVLVDWGDASQSTANVVDVNGQFYVVGGHAYADPGKYIMRLTAFEPRSAFVT